MATTTRSVLRDDALYLGDGGHCFCGAHAGTTARLTGRDLSGQKLLKVTPAILAEAAAMGFTPRCDICPTPVEG